MRRLKLAVLLLGFCLALQVSSLTINGAVEGARGVTLASRGQSEQWPAKIPVTLSLATGLTVLAVLLSFVIIVCSRCSWTVRFGMFDFGGSQDAEEAQVDLELGNVNCDAEALAPQQVCNLKDAGLELKEELGHDAFGTVCRAVFHSKEVAVKPLSQDSAASKEVHILSLLGAEEHPHVLKIQDCFACGGDYLETALTALWNSTDYSEDGYMDQLRFFSSRICLAMAFLHRRNIGHFDLKAPTSWWANVS
jgi:hypothetical protein